MSLNSGTLPDAVKIARVTPVFKSGNPEEVGNYSSSLLFRNAWTDHV